MKTTDDAIYAPLPEQVRSFVKSSVVSAQEALLAGESITASMFLNSGNRTDMHKIPVDTSSGASKDACVVYAKQIAALKGSTVCVFMSESWGLSRSDAKRHEYIIDRYGAIANYPGKLDLLFLNVETDEGVFALQAEIVGCPPSKRKRTLKINDGFIKVDSSSGRMSGILPKRDGAKSC